MSVAQEVESAATAAEQKIEVVFKAVLGSPAAWVESEVAKLKAAGASNVVVQWIAAAETAAKADVQAVETKVESALGVTTVGAAVTAVETDAKAAATTVVADVKTVVQNAPATVVAVESAAKTAIGDAQTAGSVLSTAVADVKAGVASAPFQSVLSTLGSINAAAVAAAPTVLADVKAGIADVKAVTGSAPVSAVTSTIASVASTVVKDAPGVFSKLVAVEETAFSGVKSASSLVLPVLGALLKAPFKALSMIPWPGSLGLRIGAIALIALAIGGTIFAGYKHVENNQLRLIAQTSQAAESKIIAEYNALSEELTRTKAERDASAQTALAAADKASDAEDDAAQGQIDAIPEVAPVATPKPVSTPEPKSLRHAHKKHKTNASDFSELNAAAARVDRLLERSSGARKTGPR